MSEAAPSSERTAGYRADVRGALACAAGGVAAFALVELVITTIVTPASPGLAGLVRFAALTVTLSALLYPLVAVLFVAAAWLTRAIHVAFRRQAAAPYPGLFATADAALGSPRAGALFWGFLVGALVFIAGSSVLTTWAVPRFKNVALMAILLALLQVGVLVVAAAIGLGAGRGAAALGRLISARLHPVNPFTRVIWALLLAAALALPALLVAIRTWPQLRPLVPWRLGLSALAIAIGVSLVRGPIAAVAPRLLLKLGGRRSVVGAIAVLYVILVPATLLRCGADPGAKAMAVTSSPALSMLVDGVRKANDVDRDGYGSWLGETDCAPFDAAIHPLAAEIPDNGTDENCDGRDLELARLEIKAGETPPVPEGFKRDWNVLLLTVDTVRYDHTSFGGYIERSNRDTTPELAKLVGRSVSFEFCIAPSAGTMASIPAMLTSKFFHSGIALGPDRKGMPPITKPENLLVSELFKEAGYQTGAIVTHYYFNDWGLDQGFDTYDNTIGKKSKPRDVSSDRLTDRLLSWVANHAGKKWFLWGHYLDPHGRYVAHPGEMSYGSTEKDLYDGELHFTDQHIGRLLRELARIPGVAENTIIVITSDHGDAFREHGFINHGQALYKELVHVPLIFYIPSVQPRVVPGPVSPLDIVPTLLDLVGIDRSRYSFEGESLVPQLFYGADARDRIVFTETNWPKPQRAVVSNRYKLIRKIQDNLFELYDLEKDPLEKKNIAAKNKTAFAEMNKHLEAWLERVYYNRDQVSNQHMLQLKDALLAEAPTPAHPLSASYDGGRIELLGWDVTPTPAQSGDKLFISIYFRALQRPSADFKLQTVLLPPAGSGMTTRKSKASFTAKGTFPTGRWRKGEYIRHESRIRLQGALDAETLTVGLRLLDQRTKPIAFTGGDALVGAPSGTLRLGDVAIVPKTDAGPTLMPRAPTAPGRPAPGRP